MGMKRDKLADRSDAISILQACRCPIGTEADFHTLGSRDVEMLLYYADRAGYRAPRNANGSRARYFHDHLQRKAKYSA